MEEKFIDLLYENQGIVHKVCNLYFANRTDKEDYHQELIIQLWKAFPSYKGRAKFSTWMYRVCINAAIDITRKEKRQIKQVQLLDTTFPQVSDEDDSTSTQQEQLYRAINKLSDVDKAIITLYLEEYSYQEIAEMIGISKTYTGVKISRIKSGILKSFEHEK